LLALLAHDFLHVSRIRVKSLSLRLLMSYIYDISNLRVNLTDNTLKKIHSLVDQEGDKNSVLQIAVSGGGCSGFTYDFLMDQVLSLSDDDDDDDYDDESDDDDYDYEEDESYHNFSKKGKDIVIKTKTETLY
jgi:Fe-S cluster assembly iron-binding protein IscA